MDGRGPFILLVFTPALGVQVPLVMSAGQMYVFTICCQAVRLSGTVSSQKADETVLILARNSDWVAPVMIKFANTDANGNWTAVVRPHIETTYRAQAGSEPTAGITVHVRPRVGLGISGRRFTTKVTARDSPGFRCTRSKPRRFFS